QMEDIMANEKRLNDNDCDCDCAQCEDDDCENCSMADCNDAECRSAGCPNQVSRSVRSQVDALSLARREKRKHDMRRDVRRDINTVRAEKKALSKYRTHQPNGYSTREILSGAGGTVLQELVRELRSKPGFSETGERRAFPCEVRLTQGAGKSTIT